MGATATPTSPSHNSLPAKQGAISTSNFWTEFHWPALDQEFILEPFTQVRVWDALTCQTWVVGNVGQSQVGPSTQPHMEGRDMLLPVGGELTAGQANKTDAFFGSMGRERKIGAGKHSVVNLSLNSSILTVNALTADIIGRTFKHAFQTSKRTRNFKNQHTFISPKSTKVP